MGLFDFADDPQSAMMMQAGLGLLAAGGPSLKPVSVGQGIAQAGQQAIQGYREARQAQIQNLQLQQLLRRNSIVNNVLGGIQNPNASANGVGPIAGGGNGVGGNGVGGNGVGGNGVGGNGVGGNGVGGVGGFTNGSGYNSDDALAATSDPGLMKMAELHQARQMAMMTDAQKQAQSLGFIPGTDAYQNYMSHKLTTSQNGMTSQETINHDGTVSVSAPNGAMDTYAGYKGADLANTIVDVKLSNGKTVQVRGDIGQAILSGQAPNDDVARLAAQTANMYGLNVKISTGKEGLPTNMNGGPAPAPVIAPAPQGPQASPQAAPAATVAPAFSMPPFGMSASATAPGMPSAPATSVGLGTPTAAQSAQMNAAAEAAKTRAVGSETSGQAYQSALHDKVEEEFQLVNRNNQIMPLLDKFSTGGVAPEDRLKLGSAIANTSMLPDSVRKTLGNWVAGGDVTSGKVLENQLASAGILTMLQTLDKEGKPNRAIFQAVHDAQEGLDSGNTTLKDVFELQRRLYDLHYNEEQALTDAKRKGTYNPGLWQGDYSAIRNATLGQPPAQLPDAQSSPQSGGPTKIKGNADYDALPSGSVFIDPFGKQRRKP